MDEARSLVNEFREYNAKNKVPATYVGEPVLPTALEFLNYVLTLCETKSEDDVKKSLCFSYERVFEILTSRYELPELESKILFRIITNPKFLIAVGNILSLKAPNITDLERVACGYMYLLVLRQTNTELQRIYSLYYNLVKITNRKLVLTLSGVNGLNEDNAVLLSAARYSRTNFAIDVSNNLILALRAINREKELSISTISTIFQIIFEGDTNMQSYLSYIMLYGTLPCDTTEFERNVANAILCILESIPTAKISDALITYVKLYNYELYYSHPICPRVSFGLILGQLDRFPRIGMILNSMLTNRVFQHCGLKIPD